MQSSTLTSKGQVTIPAELRRLQGLKPGDRVAFVVENGQVLLVRAADCIETAFGLIHAETSVSLEHTERVIRERAGN